MSPQADFESSIVRIDVDGKPQGTGFVIAEGQVMTCAHVVANRDGQPVAHIDVVFHLMGESRAAQVVPEYWRAPNADDVAVLRFAGDLPQRVRPAQLGHTHGTRGHDCITFGYPSVGAINGVHGRGTIYGHVTEASGRRLLQVSSKEITPGFSGAPVFDLATRRVIGMVTEIANPDRYGRLGEVAFLTPSETLQTICPQLQLSDVSPYRGLLAFTEDDEEFFFGRRALINELSDHLRRNPRFLSVVGSSGSGKSSVVQAGLIPRLRRGEVPGFQVPCVILFRPGRAPLEVLRAELNKAGIVASAEAHVWSIIQEHCQREPTRRLVLYGDQFEELFALCTGPLRSEFLRGLAELVNNDLPVTLLLTIRADFYDPLLRSPLGEFLNVGQVNIRSLTQSEVREVILEPAKQVGLEIESGLDDLILKDLATTDYPLPLLEFALEKLWTQRQDGVLTHEGYKKTGGATGAIGQWASETYQRLTEEEKELTRRIFTRLIHYGEGDTPDTRQRAALADLLVIGEKPESTHSVVKRLADARLLVTDRDTQTGKETVEIIHDALLREWLHLREWIRQQRTFLVWRQKLDERLEEWLSKGTEEGSLLRGSALAEAEGWLETYSSELSDEERRFVRASIALRKRESTARERLRWRLTAVGLGASALLAVMALFAWVQRNEAIRHANVALSRRLAAQATEKLDQDGELSLLLALESTKRGADVNEVQSWDSLSALSQAFASAPRSVFRDVVSTAFSPDGQLLAVIKQTGVVELKRAPDGPVQVVLSPTDTVRGVVYSLNGQQLATIGTHSGTQVWDTRLGTLLASIQTPGPLKTLLFDSTGDRLAMVGEDGLVQLVPLVGDSMPLTLGEEARDLAFDSIHSLLAIGTRTGVRLVNLESGEERAVLDHPAGASKVQFTPDGRFLLAVVGVNELSVWDIDNSNENLHFPAESDIVDLAVSSNGSWVIRGTWKGAVNLINLRTREVNTILQCESPVPDVAFDMSGSLAAALCLDGVVHVFDLSAMRRLTTFGHGGEIRSMEFSPDGKYIVTTGLVDGAAKLWARETIEPVRFDLGIPQAWRYILSPDWQHVAIVENDGPVHVKSIHDMADTRIFSATNAIFSNDSKRLLVENKDGSVQVWDTYDGDAVTLPDAARSVQGIGLSPDGERVLVVQDGKVGLWHAAIGYTFLGPYTGGRPGMTAFSSDGTRLAIAEENGNIRIWDIPSQTQTDSLNVEGIVGNLAFSPDNEYLAAAFVVETDTVINLWQLSDTTVEKIRISGFYPYGMQFSPGGRRLAVWGISQGSEFQGAVHLLDSKSLDEIVTLPHFIVDPFFDIHATFSPDGRLLATAGDDGIINIVNADSGGKALTLRPSGLISQIEFSEDGRKLASVNWSGQIHIWRVKAEDLMNLACEVLTRNLTDTEWRQYLPDEPYRKTCLNLP